MNRKTLTALLGIGLIPSLLFGQFYRMDVDLQQPGQARVIDRVFTGNTVGLDVGFWDGDSAFAVTNWSMFFKYTDGQYSTNDMDAIPGTTSSNRVVFDSTTNIFYSASENYYFSIFGVDGAGRRRTFARGRLIEEYDPAASTSLGLSTGGVYIVPWGGIYGDPASSTSLVAYVTGLIGEGEEPLWIAASNSVWYRSQAVTNAEDTVARAAVAGVESNLTAHATDTDNPHGVTAEQIGALTAETDPEFAAWLATGPASWTAVSGVVYASVAAYAEAGASDLPWLATYGTALILSGLTSGSIGVQVETTNDTGIALYSVAVKDSGGEVLATIYPACDGTRQSASWPWNASETLTIEAADIASPAGWAESAIITAVQAETWADVSLVGKTNDLADQHLYVDYPAATNEAANRAYADDAADAALALALGEIATATFNRDLAGYVQRWNPRFDTVADSNSLSTLYGGSTALRLDGEGAAVVPEILAFAVESGEVATLTVWSYSGGATNLVPEVTTNLITGSWEQKPESIVSATNIDAFTAQVVFTNDFERLLYVRLVDVSGGSGVPVFRVFGGIAFGDGEAITDWPTSGSGISAAEAGQIATNVLSNATTNDMPGVDWGSLGGGGTPTTNAFAGLPSLIVDADWTWTNMIYAVGADTSTTNIAITLPDAGTNFTSIVIRKFSNLNQLLIKRGTNTVYTLNDDGSARAYDWWPQRTNWFWRN